VKSHIQIAVISKADECNPLKIPSGKIYHRFLDTNSPFNTTRYMYHKNQNGKRRFYTLHFYLCNAKTRTRFAHLMSRITKTPSQNDLQFRQKKHKLLIIFANQTQPFELMLSTQDIIIKCFSFLNQQ